MVAVEDKEHRLSPAGATTGAAAEIDRSSPVPLYHQVYSAILHDIRDGRLRVGETLPTEAEIGERFGVSRITVRQAIADLLRAGHLTRERSRGPLIIKGSPIEQRLARLTSFFIADALAQGREPRFVFLGARRTNAEGQADSLGLDVSDVVTRIDRLVVERGETLAMLTSYIPERWCPNLIDLDLSGSIVPVLEEHYGRRMTSAVQRVSARIAVEAERKALGLEPRGVVVVIKRLTRDQDGEPIEFLECVLRADRYEFVMDVAQDQG